MAEQVLDYAKGLVETIHSGAKKLQNLAESSEDKFVEEHDNYKLKAYDLATEYVKQAKETAQRMNCKDNSVYTQLEEENKKVNSRWDTCFNFTYTFMDLGKFILNISDNAVETETVFCNAIQNVSRCDGGFFSKWGCVSAGLQAYSGEFKEQASLIWSIFTRINLYIEQIVELLFKCVTRVGLETQEETLVILKNC